MNLPFTFNLRDASGKQGPYATRSSAIRAARQACRRALGSSYEAHEGPDFVIYPASEVERLSFADWFKHSDYSGASYFQLRGPAAGDAK